MNKPFVWITLFSIFICCRTASAQVSKDTTQVEFESEGYTLQGQLIAPINHEKKYPVLIFLVGSGGNSSPSGNYKDFVEYFLLSPFETEEVAVFLFDKRGVGKSDGDWYKTSFEQRALDTKMAAEAINNLPFVDSERLFVIGHSQGGWIVQLCLSLYPETFAGGISLAGATFGVKQQLINDYTSSNMCTKGLSPDKALKKAQRKVAFDMAFVSLFPMKDNWKQLKLIKKFEVENYLKVIHKPLLFVWGEHDALVNPIWCTEALQTAFAGQIPFTMRLHTVLGANHSLKLSDLCYNGKYSLIPYSEEAQKVIKEWFLHEAGLPLP